ncbi:MAG: DNA mismatch repair protein MutL [Clostridiales bacterium]|nr:glutamate mutase L [Bacillota bacterium]MEE0516500.1 GlmL-related ornithine degradation protein [Anaerovoracaceae bacterium]PWL94223.1 MAG: DNA mismatch repair protein MutL [Clostridiales bacterium]
MRVDVLVAEIGSTTTVVNAFKDLDSEDPVFWGQGQAPTSVLDGDVRIGLQGAIDDLCRKKGIEKLEYDQMLATSSAAGGLKMTVHGLVYDMTAKAAKEAALGAGGIIHDITVGRLRRSDLARIKEINPNLILIAGGVDYGERDTAVYNAEMIRSLGLKTPVVYAGNIENQDEMKLIFDEESGQYLYLVDNVYPKIDTLNVEPCRKVIQDAFEDHITHAPGMEHVRDMVNGPIIPTPGAVMECTKLLYDCIGDVMTIDVGGATTDVHAVTEDSDAVARILTAPEPKAKRTVEGDLGVYVNRMKVIESIGEVKLREECENTLHIDLDKTLESYVAIPKTEDEFKLVERLTKEATLRAVERHAGQIRYVYGPSGRQTLAEGKDLTQVKYIVGTGGALTRLPHRVEIMEMIPKDNETGMKLYPSDAVKVLVDNDYIMASLGVLSKAHRQGAIKILGKSLGIELKERDHEANKAQFIEELQRLNAARKAKEEETMHHIEEMEKMGYDMSEYKNPEKIGGATAEEVAEAKKEALMADRTIKKGMDLVENKGVACGDEEELNRQQNKKKAGCDGDCKTCTRRHCPYGKK